jgi:hypothetical protein
MNTTVQYRLYGLVWRNTSFDKIVWLIVGLSLFLKSVHDTRLDNT